MQKTIFFSRLHYMARKNPSGWEGFVKLRNKGHIMVDFILRRGSCCMNPTNCQVKLTQKKSRLENKWHYGRLALSLIIKKKTLGHIMVHFN